MKIMTENAQIKTAQVEIKALTVSGKQVTLAVFKQLKHEDLIDKPTGKLNGVPWGTVNYHHDKCQDNYGEHLHVVWQRDRELLRSVIPKMYYPTHYKLVGILDRAELYLAARIAEGWEPQKPNPIFRQDGSEWFVICEGERFEPNKTRLERAFSGSWQQEEHSKNLPPTTRVAMELATIPPKHLKGLDSLW